MQGEGQGRIRNQVCLILKLVLTSLIQRASQELFSEFLKSAIEPLMLLLKNLHKTSHYWCPYTQQAAVADPCGSPDKRRAGHLCAHTPHSTDARIARTCPNHTSHQLTDAHTCTHVHTHVPPHTSFSTFLFEILYNSPHLNKQIFKGVFRPEPK